MKIILKLKRSLSAKNHVTWIAAALAVLFLISGCGAQGDSSQNNDRESDQLSVVATVFPAYDFARAIGGETAEVTLLLPPGAESHSYEPTPTDILAVQQCDLFIYLGGESDTWVETFWRRWSLRGRRCG